MLLTKAIFIQIKANKAEEEIIKGVPKITNALRMLILYESVVLRHEILMFVSCTYPYLSHIKL